MFFLLRLEETWQQNFLHHLQTDITSTTQGAAKPECSLMKTSKS